MECQSRGFDFRVALCTADVCDRFVQPLYWRLPARFLGDKCTAYGGALSFSLRYSGAGGPSDQYADVIIYVSRPPGRGSP